MSASGLWEKKCAKGERNAMCWCLPALNTKLKSTRIILEFLLESLQQQNVCWIVFSTKAS
jgi:hypothetical protein